MTSENNVAVIGGGAIGSAVAYYLAKKNIDVSLFERGELASGASGANQGSVIIQFFQGHLLTLVLESRRMLTELPKELEYDFETEITGSIIVVGKKEQWDAVEANARALRKSGVGIQLIGGKELREFEPDFADDIPGASVCNEDLLLNPMKLVFGFARAAQRFGAKIYTNTEVSRINVKNGAVRSLETNKGRFETGTAVVACGAWSSNLGDSMRLNIPVRARKGQLIVTEPVRLAHWRNVVEADYLMTAYDYRAVSETEDRRLRLGVATSLSQSKSGNWLIGSSRELVGFDTGTNLETLQYIAGRAARFIPRLKNVNIIRTFAGLRPFCDDGKPIVGDVEGIDGLVIATGHHGEGIMFAPIMGRLVSEQIVSGTTSYSIDEFNLSRFHIDRPI